jgi:hypothetical protein
MDFQRQSLWLSSQIFSTLSVVFLVLGRPESSSSSTNTRSALKHECHSKTAVWLKNALQKSHKARVLVANLASFTQNLMQTRCSILPSIADKTKQEVQKALV